MKAIVTSLLVSVVGVAVLGSAALAADIIEPIYEPIPEVVPVEVGSGWYLRGDVSYDFESDYEGEYRTFSAVDPTCGSLCGSGYDSFGYDAWTLEEAANVGVGFGYQFNSYLRGDLTAHYWNSAVYGVDKGASCDGITFTPCGSEEESEVTAWELMANAYVDLGTFAGFTPYVGGGLGAVHVAYDDFDSKTYDSTIPIGSPFEETLPGEESWRFAYALMAGASYDLTQSLKLDVGYRYVNVEGGDMWGFNSDKVAQGASGIQGTDDGFDRHTIQAGVRYSLF